MERGKFFGMVPPLFMNWWLSISSRLGRLAGSRFSILVMRFRAASEMGRCSGKE